MECKEEVYGTRGSGLQPYCCNWCLWHVQLPTFQANGTFLHTLVSKFGARAVLGFLRVNSLSKPCRNSYPFLLLLLKKRKGQKANQRHVRAELWDVGNNRWMPDLSWQSGHNDSHHHSPIATEVEVILPQPQILFPLPFNCPF